MTKPINNTTTIECSLHDVFLQMQKGLLTRMAEAYQYLLDNGKPDPNFDFKEVKLCFEAIDDMNDSSMVDISGQELAALLHQALLMT